MDKKELKELTKISGYKLNEEALERGKNRGSEKVNGDDYLENDIYITLKATRDNLLDSQREMIQVDENEFEYSQPPHENLTEENRQKLRKRIAKVFGNSEEEKKKAELLRPYQSEFVKKFFSTRFNWGMAFRTGMGKTRTFLEIASRQLISEPDKIIIISTPVNNLVKQIKDEVKSFESLKLLGEHIAKDVEKVEIKNPGNTFEEVERAAIKTENDDYEKYIEEIKIILRELGERVIVATPQKIEAMISKKKIPAESIGLFIIDEGGVGTSSKSGRYSTFKIYEKIRDAGYRPRVLCADATPTEFDYLKEKFNIREWDFGDTERFSNIHISDKINVHLNKEHNEACLYFIEILKKSWKNFATSLDRDVWDAAPELHGVNFLLKEDEQPYLAIETYEKLKKILSHAKRHTSYRDVKLKIDNCFSYLTAFFKTQMMYGWLINETFETVIEKIESTARKYLKTDSEYIKNNLRRVLQVKGNQPLRSSPLLAFAKHLRNLKSNGAEHSKIEVLEATLKNLVGNKKRVLVLCNFLETANILNHQANSKWKVKSAVIHGSAKQKKKNSMRQQFVFKKFSDGGYDVIFATSVAERGMDLPQIDWVVSYVPSKNTVSEFQAMGRMRKGGTMTTLVTSEETGKFYKNVRAREEFLEIRKKYNEMQQNRRVNKKEIDLQKSKFHEKKKTTFFVKDLERQYSTNLDLIVSERFWLYRIGEIQPKVFYNRNKKPVKRVWSVALTLMDKTGVVRCYYSFPTKADATNATANLKNDMPVIVNGVLRKSRMNDTVYILAEHDPKYVQQGVFECPIEDADLDSLKIQESASLVTSAVAKDLKTLISSTGDKLPARKGPDQRPKSRKKQPPEEQLGFADILDR